MKGKGPKPARIYVVNGMLACCVLYYALSLSSGNRSAIDWIVAGLIGCAIVWNVIMIGRGIRRQRVHRIPRPEDDRARQGSAADRRRNDL